MKRRNCVVWGTGLGVLGFVVLCLAGISLTYIQARTRALDSRPLVLIHSPANHEQTRVGDGIVVHATARSESGVSRIELWADGELVTVREPPEGEPVTPLVLSASWQTDLPGSHVLLVRAVASKGVEGQATVSVEAVGEVEAALGGHIVEEGDTLEAIAEQYAVSPEDLVTLNPDVGPGGIAPGDELVVPGGAGAGEEPPVGERASEPPSDGGVEPPAEDSAPGSFLEVVDVMGVPDDWLRRARMSDDPLSLRVEALSLQTGAAYERLHCYIGLGGSPPRWYPDADGDQTTDESFAPLEDRMWDVGEVLAGEAAPVITWPGNQSLSLDADCVGILGGGTDAVDLGHLALEIPPQEWDGVSRQSPEARNEGSFRLEYRVGPADGQPRGIPLWLDPAMTPPTDLRLFTRGFGLYWLYYPEADEEPIDGFRIYLNGTALWAEPPEARTTDLPREYLFPPCGEQFTFTVTAFREGVPDGPESMPAAPPVIIEADPEQCHPEWIVTFLTLTTYDLGGDGQYEDRSGDVGPVYGYVYANDQLASFNGRSDTWEGIGLSHNSQYDINDLTTSANWAGSGPAQFRVELAEDEQVTLGFHIDDEDTGRCHDSDDPGCDDLVCEGETWFSPSLTTEYEGTITSHTDPGYCEVSYALVPIADRPSVEPGGEIPLPWLAIDDLTMGEADQVRIHVRNIGAASWPSRDLKVELLRPTGESIMVRTWPEFSLAPGETTILQEPDIVAEEPVCVILDPDNEVTEEFDRLASQGVFGPRAPVCIQLPDLVITGVEYDPDAGRLLVFVQNQGDGTLDDRTIDLTLRAYGARAAAPPAQHANVSLAPWDTVVLTMTAPQSVHADWFAGYVVTADPDDQILESDNGNNSYTVPRGGHLELTWVHAETPFEARNSTEFQILVYIVSAGSRRQVVDWRLATEDIDDWTGGCERNFGCDEGLVDNEFDVEVDVAGDESLEITTYANLERAMEDDWGHTFTWMAAGEEYTAADSWGAGAQDPIGACTSIYEGPGHHRWELGSFVDYGWTDEYQPWTVTFNLCLEDAGD